MGVAEIVGLEGLSCHGECVEISILALGRAIRPVCLDIVQVRVDVESGIVPCNGIGACHCQRSIHQCTHPGVVERSAASTCHLSREFVGTIVNMLGERHVDFHDVAFLPFTLNTHISVRSSKLTEGG